MEDMLAGRDAEVKQIRRKGGSALLLCWSISSNFTDAALSAAKSRMMSCITMHNIFIKVL